MRKMMTMMLALASLASLAGDWDRELPRGTGSFWDRKALDAPPRTFAVEMPCSNNYGRIAGVEPIWIEGEPYRGKPTRVFAWWGLPKNASADAKVPAMVLVHGGGGTAFAKWVKIWNDRGYAAIAMDTCGKIPQGQRDGGKFQRHPWSGPNGWGESCQQVNEPLKDQWTYHAIAAILRSHSFLRNRPEVDANRIGLTGISWGGYLTSIAMSVDRRFKFAAPVYGCGWYDLNPMWGEHMGKKQDDYRKWLALWDPKNFLQDVGGNGARIPVLWCVGTNDFAYPVDAVRRSCNELDPSAPLSLSVKLRMPHGHGAAGDPKEITALANHHLRGGAPLVEVKEAWVRDGRLHVVFDAHGRKVVRAELLSTCDGDAKYSKRSWEATPVAEFNPARSSFSTPVSDMATVFLANVITDDGLVASTRIFERADWGLVNHPQNPATDWMAGKTGLFMHFLYGADVAGRVAAEFNVEGLVRQVVDAKADYLVMTLGQNSGWMCSPNATYEQKVGYPIGSRCCPRDIPMEVARALRRHGVKFMLYLPCQAPNGDARAENAFGFGGGKGDRQIYRDAAREWAKVIEEWSRRYGDLVSGWWFDGGYRWIRFDDEIAEIYAAACKRGNPNAVVAFNEGVVKPMRRWTQAGDYLAGEVNEPFGEVCKGRFFEGRQWQLLTFCGSTWGRPNCRYSDEQWINWMKPVLANGGAVTVDVNVECPSGHLRDEQVAQMKRVFAAAKAKPAADYVVAVEKGTKADPAWNAVVEALKAKHAAAVLEYDGNAKLFELLPALKQMQPKYVCFVSKSETAGRDLVVRAAQLLRRIDDDPYGDALWGIITGFDAGDALRLAKVPKAKEIRRAATSMGFPDTLDPWDAGFASDEWCKTNFWRRLPGGKNEMLPIDGDPAKALANAFNTIDVDYFVTSGHGHMRNWQIIYNKNEGYLKHDDQAKLIFYNPANETFPLTKASPKVYLAAGNCLIGNIDRPACMTTAWLHSGGAEQLCAYTHVTFFGFMGWGVKSQFEEARCSFAEAYYLQNQLLLWAALNIRDGALATTPIDPEVFAQGPRGLRQAHEKELVVEKGGRKTLDSASVGYLWDRDLVAFYGDPAYQVTFPEKLRTLDVTVKGAEVTVEFLRDLAFGELLEYKSPRPVVKLLDTPPPGMKLVDAAGKPVEKAVVNDRFVLIPFTGSHKQGERWFYRIVK